MANLKNQLAAEEAQGLARAIRLALRFPLITHAAQPEAYKIVHRHRAEATQWFSYFCGWKLETDARSSMMRLYKLVVTDDRHFLRRPRGSKAPFDRRRYMLLCLASSVLLSRPVIVLTELSEQISLLSAEDGDLFDYRMDYGPHRRELVDVVLFLDSVGALTIRDGNAETWQSDRLQSVLLRANSAVLMSLLASPQPPSRLESREIDALTVTSASEFEAENMADGNRAQFMVMIRRRIMRRLADTAVIYFDELSSEELNYVRSLTGRRQVEKAASIAGMVCEWRAEGIMWVDVDRIATDETFPDTGATAKQAALFLLDYLHQSRSASLIEVEESLRHTLADHPRWAKEYRAPGGMSQLVDEALSILSDFGLARREGSVVEARPAADRYHVTSAKTAGSERK